MSGFEDYKPEKRNSRPSLSLAAPFQEDPDNPLDVDGNPVGGRPKQLRPRKMGSASKKRITVYKAGVGQWEKVEKELTIPKERLEYEPEAEETPIALWTECSISEGRELIHTGQVVHFRPNNTEICLVPVN